MGCEELGWLQVSSIYGILESKHQSNIFSRAKQHHVFHIINHYVSGEDAELVNKISIYLKSYWIGNFSYSVFSQARHRRIILTEESNKLIHLFKEHKRTKTLSKTIFSHGKSYYKVIFNLNVLKIHVTNENLLIEHRKMHSWILACNCRRLSDRRHRELPAINL